MKAAQIPLTVALHS